MKDALIQLINRTPVFPMNAAGIVMEVFGLASDLEWLITNPMVVHRLSTHNPQVIKCFKCALLNIRETNWCTNAGAIAVEVFGMSWRPRVNASYRPQEWIPGFNVAIKQEETDESFVPSPLPVGIPMINIPVASAAPRSKVVRFIERDVTVCGFRTPAKRSSSIDDSNLKCGEDVGEVSNKKVNMTVLNGDLAQPELSELMGEEEINDETFLTMKDKLFSEIIVGHPGLISELSQAMDSYFHIQRMMKDLPLYSQLDVNDHARIERYFKGYKRVRSNFEKYLIPHLVETIKLKHALKAESESDEDAYASFVI